MAPFHGITFSLSFAYVFALSLSLEDHGCFFFILYVEHVT